MEVLKRNNRDKLYISPVGEILDKINIPECQRTLNSEHLHCIYSSLLEEYSNKREPKLIGCIVICVYGDVYYLVDGQHRLFALKKLYEEKNYNAKIYVQELTVKNFQEVENIFKRVNNSIPVSKLAEGVKRSDVNIIAEYFYNKYKSSISGRKPLFTTSNAVRPRINITKFEESLSQIIKFESSNSKIIDRIEEFIRELDEYNVEHFKLYTNDRNYKIQNMLDTADSLFSCRLGMVHLTDMINLFGESRKLFVRKENIPSSLKRRVWDIYIGKDKRIGECPFCEIEIRFENFHCAHNLAESKGGDLTIDNLFPCCGECNLSMGTMSYEEFIESFR